jgi:hypothetical protein
MTEELLADAAAQADEIRARAQVEAGDIITAARVECRRVESELQLCRQRELGALAGQAQHLQAEIDRLSGLESHYHAALQGLLSEQQRLLDQRVPGPDAEAAAEATSATAGLRPAA